MPDSNVLWGGVLLLSILLLLFRMRLNDPYPGLFHLSLNKLPHEDIDAPPKTEWLNVGYWKDTTVFPDACKALALKLMRAAQLERGQAVLDVGHGTGDSLLLLLADPSIAHPSSLTGITSLPIHHEHSKDRIARIQKDRPELQATQVDLYLGDAVCERIAIKHPLYPNSTKKQFDRIIALDCAFHFNTRRRFLLQSFGKLAPGGKIALADICFAPGFFASRRARFLASAMKLMPRPNMITKEEYTQQLLEIGYTDIEMEDITEHVLPGFVKLLKSQGWVWWVSGVLIDWYLGAGARYVIVCATKAE